MKNNPPAVEKSYNFVCMWEKLRDGSNLGSNLDYYNIRNSPTLCDCNRGRWIVIRCNRGCYIMKIMSDIRL